MSLNESILEDAALEWFGELGYAGGYGPQLAPCEPASDRVSCRDVVLVGRLREAIRRLKPGHSTAKLFLPARHAAAEAAERRVERELTHHRITKKKPTTHENIHHP